MAYTEFRKSYGDFEIIIAPVDFSCLTKFEARRAVDALQKYESGFVCHALENCQSYEAMNCIGNMLEDCHNRDTIGGVVDVTHPWLYDEGCWLYLDSDTTFGITFRKVWVKHLISDIMREHELEAAD